MIVADSDVLIDALRGREPSSSRVLADLTDRGLATTAVRILGGGHISKRGPTAARLASPAPFSPQAP